MSLQTWKDEFYPVEAQDATATDLQAVRHSVLKWSGLSKETLDKHGLKQDGYLGGLIEEPSKRISLIIDSDTCALCVRYDSSGDDCERCPLTKVRGGKSCVQGRDDEGFHPYDQFTDHGNPAPMLAWLLKAESSLIASLTQGLSQALDKMCSVLTLQAQYDMSVAEVYEDEVLFYGPDPHNDKVQVVTSGRTVSAALTDLIPEFEYPDWSHRMLADVVKEVLK